MQALWRSLHNTNDNVYPVAFRYCISYDKKKRVTLD